mgnify:CR=1 FL=1
MLSILPLFIAPFADILFGSYALFMRGGGILDRIN